MAASGENRFFSIREAGQGLSATSARPVSRLRALPHEGASFASLGGGDYYGNPLIARVLLKAPEDNFSLKLCGTWVYLSSFGGWRLPRRPGGRGVA